MDIVGPLPKSGGYKYLLAMIDRFSRWPEAVPLKDMEALTVCRAFVDHWISRFGALEILSTDQGSPFESQLFKALLQLVGCQRSGTTAYHPASNGMIERWHRSLKAALMCHTGTDWSLSLSTVLLGLRSNVMDFSSSPAEFIYGTTLRIPGEFVLTEDFLPNPQIFLKEFQGHIRKVKPVSVTHRYSKKAFVSKDLRSCYHAFLRVGSTRRSLEQPYTGSHRILNRATDRMSEIDFNGTPPQVSIEKIKPAYFVREDVCNIAPTNHDTGAT